MKPPRSKVMLRSDGYAYCADDRSVHVLAILFSHPSLAFDLMTRHDPAKKGRSHCGGRLQGKFPVTCFAWAIKSNRNDSEVGQNNKPRV